MSGIYGLVRFSGGVHVEHANAMREAMSYWGADAGAVISNVAALGSLGGSAPRTLADGSVIVCTARLDNRDELLAQFSLPDDASDAALVAEAWLLWREAACEHLFGDWSFAAWLPHEKRLVLARDHFGNTALYYHRGKDSFAVGSSRKALLALSDTPRRLNELRLAQHLGFWVTDGFATLHDGILRLAPGHRLIATETALHVERYWHPENLPELRLRDDGEYVEAFLEHFDRAVRSRLRTDRRIATTLSSGLDSGSVTALAARALGPATDRLTAFTSVPRFPEIAAVVPRVTVDEWDLAHVVARRSGIDDHRKITAPEISTLTAIERSLFLHDEPEYGIANLHWILSLLEQAQRADAGILLTGQFGNGGVSWSGDQQRPLRSLLSGNLIESWKALREFQRNRGTSVPRAAWMQVVFPMFVRAKACTFRHGWSRRAMQHSAMAPQFAARTRIESKMRAANYDPLHSQILDPLGQRLRVLLPEISPFGALWHETAAGYSLEILDPTADVRLLEFVLAVPDDQFVRGNNDRWLIRRAMEGILPAEVQWNVDRGTQGADLFLRIRAERGELEPVVACVLASPIVNEYIDTGKLRAAWETIVHGGETAAFASAAGFARLLAFAIFLERTDFRGGVASV